MTLVDCEGIYYPIPAHGNGFVNAGTIDAAGEQVAFIFEAPKTGNIDRVCFRTGTITTGWTADVRLETVSTANGDPTGTLVGVNTNGAQVIANADDNTWFETTLTAAAAVTRGTRYALCVVWAASGNGIITASLNNLTTSASTFPYVDHFTAAWAKSATLNMTMAVRYDDTTYPYIEGCLPASNNLSLTVGTGTSPDEVGNKFVQPFDCRASGVWVAGNFGADQQVILYSSADAVLATATADADQDSGASNVFLAKFRFDASVALNAGDTYRLIIKPTTATTLTVHGAVAPSSSVMAAFPLGTVWHRTHRTDAGAWTDTTTDRIFVGLIIDQLDDGAGAGGGSSVFIHTE